MSIPDWLCANLVGLSMFARVGENWNLVFGYTLWNLWLHRNAFIFCHTPEDFGSIFACTRAMVAISVGKVSLSRSVILNIGSTPIGMEQQDWSVQFQHTKRFRNIVADAHVKSANVDSLESTLYTHPPS
ncbi:hypothetical protein V6N12_058598 [Hibiscus sabdariffa]|uniref:Uncharacterized protein n=1 Tax=Hibiscus sabdariffa TaxID=183260 RepID=A0ABR2EV96_9ROSI